MHTIYLHTVICCLRKTSKKKTTTAWISDRSRVLKKCKKQDYQNSANAHGNFTIESPKV